MPAWNYARKKNRLPASCWARSAAGVFAVYRHKGAYEGIAPVYARLLGEWLAGSGESMADGPWMEIYRNSPADTVPDNLATDLCLPVHQATRR